MRRLVDYDTSLTDVLAPLEFPSIENLDVIMRVPLNLYMMT